VRFLRDVDEQTLAAAAGLLDEKVLSRATHVVSEIRRPEQMAAALRDNDLTFAGRLMDESHASLRDLYDVSCVELDLITDLARGHGACFGARMTGAGFGGCAVALVACDRAAEFVATMTEKYCEAAGVDGAFYVCIPSAGAAILRE